MMEATRSVFLVGCGARKLDRSAPARDLYTGPLFRAALAYAEVASRREPDPWGEIYVLSAKYELLALDRVVEPYDDSLTRWNEAAIADWGVGVAAALYDAGWVRRDVELVALAGAAYVDGVRFGLRDLCREDPDHAGEGLVEPAVRTPLTGLGIGRRLRWLRGQVAVWTWNAGRPPGTPVVVRLDDGSELRTQTRSEAWALGHGEPVVKVEGIAGGYALRRVKPHEVRP